MLLRFTKMHGLGNDFMVLDLVSQHAHVQPRHVKQWGDRNFGVGFDQLLIVEPPSTPDADFRYRIFNCDGTEVEQCGNGARCFARFVVDKRLTAKKTIRVETKGGMIELTIANDGQVTVDMGPPRLVPEQVPFKAESEALSYPLEVDGQRYELAAISMGNPHGVLRVDDVDSAPVRTLGPKLEVHELPAEGQHRLPADRQSAPGAPARLGTRRRRDTGLRHRRLRRRRRRHSPGLAAIAGTDRPSRRTVVHRVGRTGSARYDDRARRAGVRRPGTSISLFKVLPSAAQTRRKQARKRSLRRVNEHFEPVSNAV